MKNSPETTPRVSARSVSSPPKEQPGADGFSSSSLISVESPSSRSGCDAISSLTFHHPLRWQDVCARLRGKPGVSHHQGLTGIFGLESGLVYRLRTGGMQFFIPKEEYYFPLIPKKSHGQRQACAMYPQLFDIIQQILAWEYGTDVAFHSVTIVPRPPPQDRQKGGNAK